MSELRSTPQCGESLTDPHRPLLEIDLSNMSAGEAVQALRLMYRARRVEEMIGELVTTGEVLCPCHLAIGQEAVSVGVLSAISRGDKVLGAHRAHAQYIALGADPEALFAEVLGKSAGCSGGFGGSMHLRDLSVGLLGTVPIVGATIPISVGAAWASKMSQLDSVCLSFFGDGATEEGVFHESANLAFALKAPVMFVCENNLFSSHLDINSRQPFDQVARYGPVHGLVTEAVDGNDVAAVHSAATRLLDVARSGQPVLLEAITFRWRGHVGPREDIDVGVGRSLETLSAWKERDPIARLERAMVAQKSTDPATVAAVYAEEDRDLSEALDCARDSEPPTPSSMFEIAYTQ